jgi:UDP-N-acetylglucosamine acyltransferase
MIAPTAIVHPGARIHPDACVGHHCIIEDDVEIGAGTRLDPFVIVKRYTTLGRDNHLYSGAQLGTDPLDKKFDEHRRTYLRIGDRNVLREYLTISRGTQPESVTVIGSDNYVMPNAHIAHNSIVGDHNVIAACTLISGHVTIEDHAFISGGVAVHQFSKIGRLAMVSGDTGVNMDLPPFFLYGGYRAAPHGLNLVGLKRYGMMPETISRLKQAYRLLYRSKLPLAEALARIEAEIPGEEAAHLVKFVRSSERGICRPE